MEVFFEELTNSLSKANVFYEHFIIMGDFNIAVTAEFCDLFNLTNLMTSPMCFTKTNESTIDLILINKEGCFQKKVTETGLSDFHVSKVTILPIKTSKNQLQEF